MSEKYGEIPPKFTAAWWGYFWEYYKWHVIITVFALVIIVVTMVQCASRPKYDITMIYSGKMNYSETETAMLESIAAQYTDDVDGNGKNSVKFMPLVFSGEQSMSEYDYAIQTKLDLSMMDECTFIYLMDKETAEAQLARDAANGAFVNVHDWCDVSDETKLLFGEDGGAYAVSLEDSKILNDSNVYCKDLYILIRQNYRFDDKNVKAYDSALETAKNLIK